MVTTSFSWPADVTAEREPLPGGGMIYHLTHRAIGRLGRLVLRPVANGGSVLDCDVLRSGSNDEIEARRRILEPLGRAVSKRLITAAQK